ncbi:MAG: metalloregulator ArsR/SmtB family transcription factor [Cyanobacteria bacterium J06636_16]
MPRKDALSLVFDALSDPTRRRIIAGLAGGAAASVGEIAEPFDISTQAISKHLKVLEKANLITRTRSAQSSLCEFQPQALKSVQDWIAQYQCYWDEQLDLLDDYLKQNYKQE